MKMMCVVKHKVNIKSCGERDLTHYFYVTTILVVFSKTALLVDTRSLVVHTSILQLNYLNSKVQGNNQPNLLPSS